jgi:four helix bundle suffix protein
MSDLIPKHGGYRNLKSFQISRLIYDVTVRFCNQYIDKFSRTKDQMVQAARSGVQNIAEGSQASATSKKTEIKLTQVARSSLEELKLDYEDFLRHRELPLFPPKHPALIRFKDRRCKTLKEVQMWVAEEHQISKHRSKNNSGNVNNKLDHNHHPSSVSVSAGQCQSISSCQPLSSSCLAANAALSLLNLACYLLDQQVERLAKDFENQGGFTERMYRIRTQKRRKYL